MSAVMSMADAAYEHAMQLGASLSEARNHGMWWLRALPILGRNLAVAGALERAFDLGWRRGAAEGDVDRPTATWRADIMAQWIPNISGKAAP